MNTEKQWKNKFQISFVAEEHQRIQELSAGLQQLFHGKYLEQLIFENEEADMSVYIGIGKEPLTTNQIIEVTAFASQLMKEYDIKNYDLDVSNLIEQAGIRCLEQVAQGVCLGTFEKYKPYEESLRAFTACFCGIPDLEQRKAKAHIAKGQAIAEGILFARDLVNCPSNQLKPMEFAGRIMKKLNSLHCKELKIQLIDADKLKTMGMDALYSVGNSSANPPCFLEIEYTPKPQSKNRMGLVGKGVTVDTGGYCLKPSSSMAGIKGDMAGAAAVAGAIYALAKNGQKKNVSAFLPMCENRISNGSLLPGDVISSYSGKTIEIMNTDAEGRLILADAVSYAVKKGEVTSVLDIATLTGAVVNMLGFSIAGVLCDREQLYQQFLKAAKISGEQYHRLPFKKEHEEMIKSEVADVKNMGDSCCGTITAGLFIREFAEQTPWIHLDIAGTAWVDTPIWKYQKTGATGAGVSTIYYLCEEE